MPERNTFDWEELNTAHDVVIGKVIADELLEQLVTDLGHPLAIDQNKPTRTVEASNAA